MDAHQVELNKRNINALVDTMRAQGKKISELERLIDKQARAIATLGNQLIASQQSMARAAATMGTGPTVR